MVYEKHIILKEIRLEINGILWENKTEIMQHVLKMHWIALLPKYTKQISKVFFLTCIRICEHRLF
jgi:hypothetical protein